MKTLLDEKMLRQLAQLANLECSSQELQSLSSDLERIATHFHTLQNLQSAGPATSKPPQGALRAENSSAPLREDVQEIFDGEQLLELAPERIGDLFRVPPVLKSDLSS